MKYVAISSDGHKTTIELKSDYLGKGGEGSVYEIASSSDARFGTGSHVAKIYHQPAQDRRREKIITMLKSALETQAITWPTAILLDESGIFHGFLMQKLKTSDYKAWSEFAHTQTRRNTAKDFDVKYALTAVHNLAAALDAVHQAGHRVGDVNESNVFVGSQADVMIVDADSAQIGQGDAMFPCLVGKAEYTAPELSHGSLRTQTRTQESDVFAFAVMTYQMLTGGAHPTDAIMKNDEHLTIVEKIRAEIYPALSRSSVADAPPRVATVGIPSAITDIIRRSLSVNVSSRPSLHEWIALSEKVLDNLQQCSKNSLHWFDKRDKMCGWCLHFSHGQPDPWSKSSQSSLVKQKKLPKIAIDSKSDELQIRRAAPARAGSQQSQMPPMQPSPQAMLGSQPYHHSSQQPKKQRGPSMLTYPDGSTKKRPSLSLLLFSNPRLAISCFANETSDSTAFWWTAHERPQIFGLLLGVASGSLMTYAWFSLAKIVVDIPEQFFPSLISYLAYFFAIMSAFIVIFFTLSGFKYLYTSKRRYQFLPDRESSLRTMLRFILATIVQTPRLTALSISAFLYAVVLMISRRE